MAADPREPMLALTSDELGEIADYNLCLSRHYREIAGTVEDPVDIAMATALANWRAARYRHFIAACARLEQIEEADVERERRAAAVAC